MPFEFDKWLNYTKAKIKDAVSTGNKKLDDLEAKRDAERADKPWLSKDGTDPSFDQVKARIEWQEEQARKKADVDKTRAEDPSAAAATPPPSGTAPSSTTDDAPTVTGSAAEPPAPAEPAATDGTASSEASGASGADGPTTAETSGPAPRSPEEIAADAEREMARLQLEERDRLSKARLEEIRKELGVEPAPPTEGA